MPERKIGKELLAWKSGKERKALFVTGAGKVGKTWTIRKFAAEQYGYFAEINFKEDGSAARIFQNPSDIRVLIASLTAYVGTFLEPGNSLIFLDNIQECPQARMAIPLLVEDGRFDYIMAGSLLGVEAGETEFKPLECEKMLWMYPMDFEEFCRAAGVQESILSYLEHCFINACSVNDSIHKTMCRFFCSYLVTGGMPEAVKCFAETYDTASVIRIQREILECYRQEIERYPVRIRGKIREIFGHIPAELNKKSRRFRLASISKKARMERYGESFSRLGGAGVALPCYQVTEPKPPLGEREKSNLFKLFLSDTGLLCAACPEGTQFEILQNHLDVNMGSILENACAQMLTAAGFKLRYFDKKNRGEVDFLIECGGDVAAVEIRPGGDYKRHAALDYVLSEDSWGVSRGIVFCGGNVEQEGKILYLPWYLAMFLDRKDSYPVMDL